MIIAPDEVDLGLGGIVLHGQEEVLRRILHGHEVLLTGQVTHRELGMVVGKGHRGGAEQQGQAESAGRAIEVVLKGSHNIM